MQKEKNIIFDQGCLDAARLINKHLPGLVKLLDMANRNFSNKKCRGQENAHAYAMNIWGALMAIIQGHESFLPFKGPHGSFECGDSPMEALESLVSRNEFKLLIEDANDACNLESGYAVYYQFVNTKLEKRDFYINLKSKDLIEYKILSPGGKPEVGEITKEELKSEIFKAYRLLPENFFTRVFEIASKRGHIHFINISSLLSLIQEIPKLKKNYILPKLTPSYQKINAVNMPCYKKFFEYAKKYFNEFNFDHPCKRLDDVIYSYFEENKDSDLEQDRKKNMVGIILLMLGIRYKLPVNQISLLLELDNFFMPNMVEIINSYLSTDYINIHQDSLKGFYLDNNEFVFHQEKKPQLRYFITANHNKIVFDFLVEKRQADFLHKFGTGIVSECDRVLIEKYNPEIRKENDELEIPRLYPNDDTCLYFPYYLNEHFNIEVNLGKALGQKNKDRGLEFLRLLEISEDFEKNSYANGFIHYSDTRPNCLSFNNSDMIFLNPNFYFCASNGELKKLQFIKDDKIDRIYKSIQVDTPKGKKSINVIPRDDIKIDRKLPSHLSNHTLLVGKWKNITVVLKEYRNFSENILKETAILASLESSSFLVNLVGVVLEEPYSMVMEYMSCGNLAELIYSNQELPWPAPCKIALDIATGLHVLHKNDIWYVDFKSKNILIDRDGHLKLTDFGSSLLNSDSIEDSQVDQECWHWTPPEFFECGVLTKATDIYSFGMILCELITRVAPPNSLIAAAENEMDKIIDRERGIYNTNLYLPLSIEEHLNLLNLPKEAEKLTQIMKDCLNIDSDKRPGAADLYQRLTELWEIESKKIPPSPSCPFLSKKNSLWLNYHAIIEVVEGILAPELRDAEIYEGRTMSPIVYLKEAKLKNEKQIYHVLNTPECKKNEPAFARRIWFTVVCAIREINHKKLIKNPGKKAIIKRLVLLGYGPRAAKFIADEAVKYLQKSGIVISTFTFDIARFLCEIKPGDYSLDRELDFFNLLPPELLQSFKKNRLAKPRRGRFILLDSKSIPGANIVDGKSFMSLLPSDQMLFLPTDSAYTPCTLDTMELLLLQSSNEWLDCIAHRILFGEFPPKYEAYKNYIEVLIPSQLSFAELELLYLHESECKYDLNMIKTLQEGLNLNIIRETVNPYQLLHQLLITAIKQNEKEKVEELLKNYPSLVNISSDLDYSPMGIAAQYGSNLVLKWLISKYSAAPKCLYQTPPLHVAVINNQFETVLTLLEAKAEVNLIAPKFLVCKNPQSCCEHIFRRSPLYSAILFNSDITIYRCLLKYGADLHQKIFINKIQTTPLESGLRWRPELFNRKMKLLGSEVTTCTSIVPSFE